MTAYGGADYEVTTRLVSALRADAGVKAIFGSPVRIEQDVKPEITSPYISHASPQDIPHFADGIDTSELFIAFDVWAQGTSGLGLAKTGLSAIRAALNLPMRFNTDNYSVGMLAHYKTTGPFRDTDGLTWHGQITFHAFAEALNAL